MVSWPPPLRTRVPNDKARTETIFRNVLACSINSPAEIEFHLPLASGQRITLKQGDVEAVVERAVRENRSRTSSSRRDG